VTLLLLVVNAVDVGYAEFFIPNSCSARKMNEQFNAMRRANCLNCDKYFHCKANYNAVYNCTGSNRRETAEYISNAREWLDPRNWFDWSDANADQVANMYGRNGNDCESAYLSAVRCAYNPVTKRCG